MAVLCAIGFSVIWTLWMRYDGRDISWVNGGVAGAIYGILMFIYFAWAERRTKLKRNRLAGYGSGKD